MPIVSRPMFVFLPQKWEWANRAPPECINSDLVVRVLRESLDRMAEHHSNFFIMRAHSFYGSAFQGKFVVRRVTSQGRNYRQPFDFLFLYRGFYHWIRCKYLPETTDEDVCFIVTRCAGHSH